MLRNSVPQNSLQIKPGHKKLTDFSQYLAIVAEIDAHLTQGTRHFWNGNGRLLWTLDQVINVILEGKLLLRCPGKSP